MSGKTQTPEVSMVWHNADKEELLRMLEREDFKSFDHLFVEFCRRRGKAFTRGAVDFKIRSMEESGVMRDEARERVRKYHRDYRSTKKTLGEQLEMNLAVKEAANSTSPVVTRERKKQKHHVKRSSKVSRPPEGWMQPSELEGLFKFFSQGYFGMLARNPQIRRIMAPVHDHKLGRTYEGRFYWTPDILAEVRRISDGAPMREDRAKACARVDDWIEKNKIPRDPPVLEQEALSRDQEEVGLPVEPAGVVVTKGIDDRPHAPMTSMNAQEREEFGVKGGVLTDNFHVTVTSTNERKSRIMKLRKEGKLNLDETLDLLEEVSR